MDIKSSIKITNLSLKFPIQNNYSKSLRQLFLKNIFNKRNKNNYFIALKDINLTLSSGDKVALIGDNGAGKTTLLRVMSEVYVPSCGSIKIKGKTVSFIDPMMGMNLEASGRENIFIRGIFLGIPLKQIRKKVSEIINFSELENFIENPLKTYSSGMIMRLGFSILTAFNADIIFMDEWLSTGDESFQKKASDKILNIIDNSHIFVMATHSMKLARQICNKIVVIENGMIKNIEKI